MAAPQSSTPVEKTEIQKDIDHWTGRLNGVAANSQTLTNVPGDAPWSTGFFDCLNPIDTCLLTCFCPCVAFGRTHHRLHKDVNLRGFEFFNASCCGWYLSTFFCGAHILANVMQRNDIRQRATPTLAGDFVTDCIKGWCCACCDLIQQDKEAIALLSKESQVVTEAPPVKMEQMSYQPA